MLHVTLFTFTQNLLHRGGMRDKSRDEPFFMKNSSWWGVHVQMVVLGGETCLEI